MFVIRESFRDDLDQILAVAKHLNTVNLPADRGALEHIVDRSVRSFEGEIEPSLREFLFVLEDTDKQRVIGTSMIHAQHGTRRAPHVYFQVRKEERYSQTLDRYFVHQCLRLRFNYNGPTEIGGLILLPEYRRSGHSLGKLLSYTRFLFIAMHRDWFRDNVLSELLPPLEPNGTSVLWEHLGKKFTGLTYREADRLSNDNKEFIHALLPTSDIYTALFPDEVQAVIGAVGEQTKGVEKILRRIGFRYAQQIDPFDGGPHFIANTDDITLVARSKPVPIRIVDGADASRPWAIVAHELWGGNKQNFRAAGVRVVPGPDGSLGVTSAVAEMLGAKDGDVVWSVQP